MLSQNNKFIVKTVTNPFKSIKLGIWTYFFLLLFEGALRKWILPQLSGPLLLIRDPVAFAIIFFAFNKKVFPRNAAIFTMVSIGFLSILTAMISGHGSLAVALYGARIFILHFPLIYIIGRVFTREDVLKIGKVTLYLAIPMAILIGIQFYSPQSSWVNRGVGDDESGGGFRGALGYFRPPGTFSFTNGTTLFFSFAASFVLYFSIERKGINKLVLFAALFAVLSSIPLSISRGLFFSILVNVGFVLMAISKKPKYFSRVIAAALVLAIALLVLNSTSFFQTGTSAFTSRFDAANKTEGGVEGVLLDRYLGGLWKALKTSFDKPFFGIGIGAGTNVGSTLLTGKAAFLAGEAEWFRLVGELGPLFGLIAIAVRLALSGKIMLMSFRRLSDGDIFAWILLGFALTVVPQGGWAQPTALGFSILAGGLVLAAAKENVIQKKAGLAANTSTNPQPSFRRIQNPIEK